MLLSFSGSTIINVLGMNPQKLRKEKTMMNITIKANAEPGTYTIFVSGVEVGTVMKMPNVPLEVINPELGGDLVVNNPGHQWGVRDDAWCAVWTIGDGFESVHDQSFAKLKAKVKALIAEEIKNCIGKEKG